MDRRSEGTLAESKYNENAGLATSGIERAGMLKKCVVCSCFLYSYDVEKEEQPVGH